MDFEVVVQAHRAKVIRGKKKKKMGRKWKEKKK